jgi:hypothetical protein
LGHADGRVIKLAIDPLTQIKWGGLDEAERVTLIGGIIPALKEVINGDELSF